VATKTPVSALAPQRLAITDDERHTLEKEARSGNPTAAFDLFLFYELLQNDRDQSEKWLRQAAENGHVIAQYNLGALLLTRPDSKSRAEGLMWLERSATAGESNARILIGKYYQNSMSHQ
jgi:TPR repeat protein